VPLVRVRRVSLGARVVCVKDGMICYVGERGRIDNPQVQVDEKGTTRILVQMDNGRIVWQPAECWNVTYERGSLASIMRYIFDVFAISHDDLVKLRRKILAADAHQHTHAKEWQGLVETAAIALVVLARLEAGQPVKRILALSKGKLCKLARAQLPE
jgi:hypothetical protein